MRGQAIIVFIFCLGAVRPLTASAQHGFDDLPVDDPSARSVLAPGETPQKKIRENIFLVADFGKSSCYAGQQIQLNYRLYTALQSSSSIEAKPSLDGFSVKEKKQDETALPDKIVDGKHYHGFTVWTVLLTPLQPGDYTVAPLSVNNEVNYTGADGKPGHYAGLVGSNKARIHVLALPPDNKPAAFAGAVGKWQVRSTLATHRFTAGENDTLFLEWTGKGSFDNLTAPAIQWPAGFRHFEPVERWAVKEDAFPQSGKKTIAIPFTAANPGQYAIPPMDFAWFDPATGKYQTGATGALPLNILAAPTTPAPPAPIQPTPVTTPTITQLLFTWWWLAAAILALGALLTVFLIRRRRTPPLVEPPPVEPQPAEPQPVPIREILPKLPEEELHLAGIKQSLISFLQSTLKTDAWAEEELVRLLQEKDIALAGEIRPVLDQCNRLLYSPHRSEPGILGELSARVTAMVNATDTDKHLK